MNFKKSIVLATTAAMIATVPGVTCFAEETDKESLINQIAGRAEKMVTVDMDEDLHFYANIEQASRADALPPHFDLRDRGVVPEVRDQQNLGTCWGFASIGASEISILSQLGMTTQEFLESTGTNMDLSEKHLAWFSTVPIQEEDEMSEHDRAQVGEGRCIIGEDVSSANHLDIGGLMGYASILFASGVGPITEELAPYTDSEGRDTLETLAGDWSLDESMRFKSSWELKDSSILPSPAGRDENGNYVYNDIATEMIKQELLEGRGVSFAYYADISMSPDAEIMQIADELVDQQDVPKETAQIFYDVNTGKRDEEDLTDEEQQELLLATMCYYMDISYDDITEDNFEELYEEYISSDFEDQEEDQEDLEEDSEEMMLMEEKAREVAQMIDVDYDAMIENAEKSAEAGNEHYINYETFAQYVWNPYAQPNHAVCIVGYDDDYPATNFLAEHQPPADGAWIVRNSWGTDYGDGGYFYLSYYDQSIMAPETFEFVTDVDAMTATELDIYEYDFMPAGTISSGESVNPIYMANEFTVESDAVLSYVSAMTANLDTNVTVAVYLLNEDSKTPVDGELLDVRTVDYKYSGYHRIPLSQHYRLPEGSKISVVQTQRYKNSDGTHYALPYTIATNCAYNEVLNQLNSNEDGVVIGIEGKIGHDESFVCVDDEWSDWCDFIGEVKAAYPKAGEYISFDNLSIKAYMYNLSDIECEHEFGEVVPYANGDVRLCTECGYALVER